ncbi:hypothetical protein RHSIM_Rhsim11G0108600 [Rhododendron simsii]|uniref:Uncharacterized protein n=1 Tax=Rhododendron simsii TaxID=118357 RepID=A0A834L908_RHOSS|nr:hypothetical protein RHSIM_Rhsim11G0108600 [Rhododendron simsii]
MKGFVKYWQGKQNYNSGISISEEGCMHYWEREQLNELINLLNESGVTTSTNTPDKLVWQGRNSGIFSVKSIYNLAASSHVNQDDTFDLIWKNVALPRVQCFGCLVALLIPLVSLKPSRSSLIVGLLGGVLRSDLLAALWLDNLCLVLLH